MKRTAAPLLLLSSLLLASCASSSKPVDMTEARRVVGTENLVRVDAEIYGDKLTTNGSIPMKYDITNDRQTTILIADLVPQATYDPDTQTVIVALGSEVPGQSLLPRLIPIQPGEKKTFSTAARVTILLPNASSPVMRFPNALRVKLNFLGDETKPFEKLVAINEKAVHDPQLADELFPKWLEQNETVVTNALPMRWAGNAIDRGGLPPIDASTPASTRAARRRRG